MKTFAERCRLSTDLLPIAMYRQRLEALHAEMLDALTMQTSELARQRRIAEQALVVCRAAVHVVNSSAYQGVSDEDAELELAVQNWQRLPR